MQRVSRINGVGTGLFVWLILRVSAGLPDVEQSAEFHFPGPGARRWRITAPATPGPAWAASGDWLKVSTAEGGHESWWGPRLALRLRPEADLPRRRLEELGVRPERAIGRGGRVWILRARDPWSAAAAAAALGDEETVEAAAPVMRQNRVPHERFGPRPNDPSFFQQWHLENRDAQGALRGPDLNPREAWPVAQGDGIIIAFADEGFEVDHPDLADGTPGSPHFDFLGQTNHVAVYGDHGTLVAGLAGARGGNRIGVIGLAPAARLASWTVFDTRSGFPLAADDAAFADMFEYRNDTVWVQNHSWGSGDERLFGPTIPEEPALTAALEEARGGRGVVMIRSAGNQRELEVNANDDGYAHDPRVIAVAAVRQDGPVASYSNPGACLLLGAPSGDESNPFQPTPGLCTTDRVGRRGWNTGFYTNDAANYATDFSGTSAAAPQISGMAALILSVNPTLGIRDVQQILLHAARQTDPADPTLQTNGAGYRVSHNQGFGIPDAGQAVRLAGAWSNRPALVTVSMAREGSLGVPDDGLRAWIRSPLATENAISGAPALGSHADDATDRVPLVYVGRATNELTVDLHGKAALIERGSGFFRDKLDRAHRAGALFAVLYNNVDGSAVVTPAYTDSCAIPALSISENDGRALVTRLQDSEPLSAQLRLASVSWTFAITNRMVCEHVGLRVRATHAHRGDLRIVLQSPAGTRSILQARGRDQEAGPDNWTYWSTQHFYESSAGTWRVAFSDEVPGSSGSITAAELFLRGVPIQDADADGLDDAWEQRWLGGLAGGPRDDPDRDGAPNAREQALGTDPTRPDDPLRLELAPYDGQTWWRLRWPASENYAYRVLRGSAVGAAAEETVPVPGRFPWQELLVPRNPETAAFFQVLAVDPLPAGR